MAEDQGTAPVADGAPAPHASDNIPVEVRSPEPLIVAKEPAPEPTAADAAPTEGGDTPAPAVKPSRLPEWAEKKLAEATFEARENKRRAKELEDKVAALEAGNKPVVEAPTAADADAARANAPAGGYKTQADFDRAVAQEADRRASAIAQQREADAFNSRSNEVYSAGKTAFGEDFDAAAQNLRAVGAMNKDVLDLVFETEDPSKVLYELGSDPDRAAAIIAMPPAKRALEIAKMSVAAPAKPTPVPLSNAPRPVTPVDGSARVTQSPSDNDDDQTFFAKREAELKATGRW